MSITSVKYMSTGLERVREVARKDRSARFTALLHHITEDALTGAYYALKKQASPGIDGCRWTDYQEGLQDRLKNLHMRVHDESYRAMPSRRVYIPKPDGKKRPLGIAALEDKIVQYAVAEVLTSVYEEDFYGFSYGFRPERGCHDALDALTVGITSKKIGWVLDADIQGFFDSISHEWILRFLECRIADRRILRLIRKWLRAGVSEEGQWMRTTRGTPQGAVISPLLANVFLHYALDDWIVHWRKKYAKGDMIIVRYADDFVLGFQYKKEAEYFLNALRSRLQTFSLQLHPDKTRLIQFGRFAAKSRSDRDERKPEAFTFLGFVHICSTRHRDGYFKILRLTEKKRMRITLARISEELHAKMHYKIEDVGQWLRRVLQGYYNYFAVPGNIRRLSSFRHAIERIWHKVLSKRSQRGYMLWKVFLKLTQYWLPLPTVLHPYPIERFCAKHP